MLASNAGSVVVLFLLTFREVRSLRPPGLVRDTYCGECPVKKTSSVEDWECYKVPEGKETHWCCKCRAGTYPSKPCRDSEPTTTTCTPCPTGTYTSEYNNVTECFKSRQFCDNLPNTKFVRGSASENNKCVCIPGTYSADPEKSGCKPHFECPEGFGVLTPGNTSDDGTCEHCKDGYCSTRKSSVEKCTLCSDDVSINATSPADGSIIFDSTTTTPSNNTPSMCQDVQCPNTKGYIAAIVFLSVVLLVAIVIGYCFWRKLKGIRHDKPHENGTKQGLHQPSHVYVPRSGGEGQNHVGWKKKARRRNDGSNNRNAKSYEMEQLFTSEGNKIEKTAEPVSQSENKANGSNFEESSQPLTLDLKVHSESQEENKATPPPQEKDLKSKKTLTYDQYNKIFHERGYRILHDPDGDGHCQFNALAWFLNHYKIWMEEWDGTILRQTIVNHIQRNGEQYSDFMGKPFDEYLKKMQLGEYGDEITLRAAANILKKEMLVIQTSNNRCTPIEPSDYIPNLDQKIILGHIDENHGMHYVCLKPENSGNPPSSDNQVNASGDPNRQFPSDQQESGSSSDRPAQNRTQSASTDHSTGEPSQQRLMSVSSDVQPELSAVNEAQLAAAPSEQPPAKIDLVQEIVNFCKQDKTLEKIGDDTLQQNIIKLLEKSDIGHKMLDTFPHHKHMDVKKCLRYLKLLTEVEFNDIEEDYKKVEEIRQQWILKVKSKYSRKLTPRYLLNLEYQDAIFRDNMMGVFKKELKKIMLPSSPQVN